MDEDEEGERGEEEGEGGRGVVVPLLKSRDPHVAGGEKLDQQNHNIISYIYGFSHYIPLLHPHKIEMNDQPTGA